MDELKPRETTPKINKKSPNYEVGYLNGFTDGYEEGKKAGYQIGTKKGFRKAFCRYKEINPNYEAMRLKDDTTELHDNKSQTTSV